MAAAYRIQQFAALAGVTVRTLHHYDRLGLLKPVRTSAGYRVYADKHLERLEQIVALRFLGFPLKEIGSILCNEDAGIQRALRNQRAVLEEKRRRLDLAIAAIRQAESAPSDPTVLRKLIEVINMQEDTTWVSKYYSEQGREELEARKHLWSPELQERVSRQWLDLIADADAALKDGADPASDRAQALAARWQALIDEFTGGSKAISEGLTRFYQDSPNWPQATREQMAPFRNPPAWEFMHKACEIRRSATFGQ